MTDGQTDKPNLLREKTRSGFLFLEVHFDHVWFRGLSYFRETQTNKQMVQGVLTTGKNLQVNVDECDADFFLIDIFRHDTNRYRIDFRYDTIQNM